MLSEEGEEENKSGINRKTPDKALKAPHSFSKALWSLTHLKRANIETNVLIETYRAMLRPLLEYCSVVYNSMLTQDLSIRLERQQKIALKIIFGFEKEYSELMELGGFETNNQKK